MKTAKFLITVIIFLLIYSDSFPQGWMLKSCGNNINSVFFISPSLGWIVGDSGICYATYDGGNNWSGLDSKTYNKLNSVFFIDANTGWAAGNKKTIIKTTNGGDEWTVLMTSTTSNLYSVYFPGYDTGYATGDSTMKTTDGGLTWTTLVGISVSTPGTSVYFSSGLKGIATQGSSRVIRTTNGGMAWLGDASSDPLNRYGMFFLNASTGWVAGIGISKTTNGGTNWITQSSGFGFSTSYGINFADENSGWCAGSIETIGGNSSIRRTTNSGVNWSLQTSGTPNILNSVSALTSSNGVTVGNTGTILLTTNSGTNWNRATYEFGFPFAPSLNLNCVHFYNDYTGWAGGQTGIVSKTTNGAATWTSVTTSSFNNLNSINFIGSDSGWICHDGGVIQKTNNAGSNWTSQFTGTSEKLNSINMHSFYVDSLFTYQQIGWCVGNSGTILWTNNGGVNWSSQVSSFGGNIYSVTGITYKVAIACGENEKIIKTTNGGTNWFTADSGAANALRTIVFADLMNGICAGDAGKVFKTTDQGNTWTELSGPPLLTDKTLFSAAADYSIMEKIIIAGDGGVIISSSDGGASWYKQSSGCKTRLYGIHCPSDIVCYAVGTRSTVLKTVDGGALPVEMSLLESAVRGNDVILYWQTSSEINNYGFDIERKSGTDNWQQAGFVKGIGNSGTVQNYSFTDNNLSPGKYNYRIKQSDFNGNHEYFYLRNEIQIEIPEKFYLSQNFPNPFNPVTKISFGISKPCFVSIKIYNIQGKEEMTLVKENRNPGEFIAEFNGNNFPSGVYFYSLLIDGIIEETKQMLLIK